MLEGDRYADAKSGVSHWWGWGSGMQRGVVHTGVVLRGDDTGGGVMVVFCLPFVPRRRDSRADSEDVRSAAWIPACAGMTEWVGR